MEVKDRPVEAVFKDSVREAYFRDLANSNKEKPGYIFSRGYDRRIDSSRINSITVVIDRHWPEEKGQPISLKNIFCINHKNWSNIISICSEVRRIQGYIESKVDLDIKVHDIKKGCVTVKYHLPDIVEGWEIQNIVDELTILGEDDVFFLSSVRGHSNGRLVKASKHLFYEPKQEKKETSKLSP